MKRYSRSLTALLSLVAVATVGASAGLLAGGCGSGGRTIAPGSALSGTGLSGSSGSGVVDRSATGDATLHVQWPTRKASSRLLPIASSTILVQITFRGKVVATQSLKRSDAVIINGVLTSTATFPSLPIGQLGVIVYAVPDTTVASPTTAPTDAQAFGSGTINIIANKTATLDLTLDTTIVSVDIVPSATGTTDILQDGSGNDFDFLTVGETHNFDVQVLDKNGNDVVLATGANSTIQWSTDKTGILKVTPHTADNGVDVTGVSSGDATLFVRESESNIQASIPVSVRGPLAAVRITSILPQEYKSGIMQFDYVGTDASGNAIPGGAVPSVTWSSSNPSIASIDSSSGPNNGQCTGISAGAAGSMSATAFITLNAGQFTDTQIITINGGMIAQQLSPSQVVLAPNTSQRFQSWTAPLNVPRGVRYTIVIPAGGNGSFGTIDEHSNQGYCIYTTPAVRPTITSNGVTTDVTTITLHASNGAPDATVVLQ